MSNKHSATKVESHGLLHDQKIRRITGDVFAHLFLAILAVIWLVPIVWVFAESFNKNTAPYTSSFSRRSGLWTTIGCCSPTATCWTSRRCSAPRSSSPASPVRFL